jgi:hypothetical protein
VQCFDLDSEALQGICDLGAAERKPLLMHVGREPKSTAYHCDPFYEGKHRANPFIRPGDPFRRIFR